MKPGLARRRLARQVMDRVVSALTHLHAVDPETDRDGAVRRLELAGEDLTVAVDALRELGVLEDGEATG